mgnify:CR=1 FL=1
MSDYLTKARARNVFYGGSLFFVAVFGVLVFDSHRTIASTTTPPLTDEVRLGKEVWERASCINCHTLFGEGAYFAPELGNVMARWGVADDPEGAFAILDGWMQSQPSGIEGRRQMPYFGLTEEETRGLAEFLRWAGRVDLQGWPPTDAG